MTDTFGFVAERDDYALIVFRGTVVKNIANWIVDLQFSKKEIFPGLPAKVHVGFLNAYLNVRNDVLTSLRRVLNNNKKIKTIKLMGHSLGGALATLAAIDVHHNITGFNYELWTFGSPRVGNKDFSSYFETKIPSSFRVTNQKDIVPHFPPSLIDFMHIPREYWFSKNDVDFKICDETGEDPYCANSITIADSITDHLTYLGYDEREGHSNGCIGENPNKYMKINNL